MKKVTALFLALALSMGLFAACGGTTDPNSGSSANQLNLYTWEGMFPQEVLDGFTAETGIEINYVNFDYDETMLAKLQAANGGEYDLVIADDYIIETVIAEGLAAPLDKTQLSNFGNINPLYQGQFYDPSDLFTVPYGAGVQTIVYNPDEISIPITGYADLWNEALVDNVGIIGNYRVINGMALKVLGESYNTENIDAIEAAGAKLIELAPNIRLIKDDTIHEDLLSGEINAAVMYTSQVTMALMANPDLEMVFPKEGIGFGIMASFIPVNAPNSEAAHLFLNYILRPEIAAPCFEYLGYYCTNKAADRLISEEFQPFLTLPEDLSIDTELIGNIGADAQEVHSRIWTEFKNACGQ